MALGRGWCLRLTTEGLLRTRRNLVGSETGNSEQIWSLTRSKPSSSCLLLPHPSISGYANDIESVHRMARFERCGGRGHSEAVRVTGCCIPRHSRNRANLMDFIAGSVRTATTGTLALDDWREMAACRGMSTAMFFQEGHQELPARSICRQCPVRQECVGEAILENLYGVWGGTNERERAAARRRRYRRTSAVESTIP
jgi:WhiB family redox-sensing transcriptional regulator